MNKARVEIVSHDQDEINSDHEMEEVKESKPTIEELEKTTVSLGDEQVAAGVAGFALKGATVGFNKDSQYNVFEQDGDLVFFRSVNGVINIVIAAGGSGFLETNVEGYAGIITFGRGDGIEIVITQN